MYLSALKKGDCVAVRLGPHNDMVGTVIHVNGNYLVLGCADGIRQFEIDPNQPDQVCYYYSVSIEEKQRRIREILAGLSLPDTHRQLDLMMDFIKKWKRYQQEDVHEL